MQSIYHHKILAVGEAQELIKNGYYALDPHCHSSYSFDVPDVEETSPERILNKQKDLGLHGIISDHDTLNGYRYVTKKLKRKIVPAVEIRIKPRHAKLVDARNIHTLHVNVFGLDYEQLEILEDIAQNKEDLDLFVSFLRDEKLEYMYNHPFWHESHEKLNWKAIPGLAKNYFDVIELNAQRPKNLNDLALHIAEQLKKGIVGGSDSHTGYPGKAFALSDAKNFNDFWHDVKEGRNYVVRRDMTPFNIIQETGEMISHIFRNNNDATGERMFTPTTGFKPVDMLARSATSGSLKNQYFLKKTISTFLQSLNYTAGPIIFWRLYISKQNNFGEKVRPKIFRLTRNLKNIDQNSIIKNNPILTDTMHPIHSSRI